MRITCENVIPIPLIEYPHTSDSLWGNTHVFEQGQKVHINAESGKGKTTLAHILAGFRHDYTGNISFDSTSISSFKPADWLRVRQSSLSFVFQDLQLFPSLTCEENILLKTNLKGGVSVSKLREWAEFLGLGDKWNTKAEIMSMGQQQRLCILRALSQPFETIVLDEPFSHLDEQNTQFALQLIQERCTELDAGFLLTTLDPTDRVSFNKEIKL